MSELNSDCWMKSFRGVSNAAVSMTDELEKIGTKSTIDPGFKGDEKPLGVIVVESDKVATDGSSYRSKSDRHPKVDIHAREKWITKSLMMTGLVMAHTSRNIQFLVGGKSAIFNYSRMVDLSGESFVAMGKA